jgi:VIT1/CCC1 family predicted Fe2+/Mn2+ transporter
MTVEPTPHHTTYINVPEAVGVFDSFEALQAAIYDLRMSGFSRFDISLLASKETIKEKFGSSYWRAQDLEDNPNAPRAAFVSEEAIGELQGAIVGGFFFLGSYIALAAMLTPISTLAASIAAIAIGGGPTAVIGALMARRIGKHHKDYYAEQIRNGGILLWVRTANKEKECLAEKILKGHSGRDVHVHPWSEA